MDSHGFPYVTVRLNRGGAREDSKEIEAAQRMITDGTLTDVLVLVHGWNATQASAEGRYERYLQHARALLDGPLKDAFQARKLGVVGLVWPSVPDALQEDPHDLDNPVIVSAANEAFRDDRATLEMIQNNPTPTPELVTHLETRVKTSEIYHFEPDATEARAVGLPDPGFAGSSAGFWRDLVVWASYYEMRDRAGRIGLNGGRGLVRDLKVVKPDLKVHLLGHSFGGRLVAAIARGPAVDESLTLASLHIIQGAFSHYGFGRQNGDEPEGYFRPAIDQHVVEGPILVTYTKDDLALRILYELASRISNQTRDFVSRFGAIGYDGAMNVPAQDLVLSGSATLDFSKGTVYNLKSDGVIPNHGDVEQYDVVRAVLRAIEVT